MEKTGLRGRGPTRRGTAFFVRNTKQDRPRQIFQFWCLEWLELWLPSPMWVGA